MLKRGNETPRKSRRLNEEASSDDFHAPSFKILSQTQFQSHLLKLNLDQGNQQLKKKTSKGKREEEKRERKEKCR